MMEKREEILKYFIEGTRGKRIAIIPHRDSDVDAIVSGFLLNKILKSYSIASFIFIESMDKIAEKVLIEKYGIEINKKKQVFFDEAIIVDTNNKSFLPVELERAYAVFDHHLTSTQKISSVYEFIDTSFPSNSLHIYSLFRNIYNFSKKEKELIDIATLSDIYGKNEKNPEKYLLDKKNIKFNELIISIERVNNKYFYEIEHTIKTEKIDGIQIIYTSIDKEDSLLASFLANKLLRDKSISVVSTPLGDRVKLSIRKSDDLDLDMSSLLNSIEINLKGKYEKVSYGGSGNSFAFSVSRENPSSLIKDFLTFLKKELLLREDLMEKLKNTKKSRNKRKKNNKVTI